MTPSPRHHTMVSNTCARGNGANGPIPACMKLAWCGDVVTGGHNPEKRLGCCGDRAVAS